MASNGPSPLNNLLSGALARHGIDKRVMATQVVKIGNELLSKLLTPAQRPDLQVISFTASELVIACKTPAARYAMEGLKKQLASELEVRFPDQTFSRINCQLRPGTVSDEEWYTSAKL